MEEERICKTPLEDLRNSALAEYELASNAIHSWNSFIVNAIKNYDPESNRLEKLVSPKIADLTTGQKIDAILNWQTDEKVHPLTCGCSATNNDEKKFEIVGKRLNGKLFIECTRCGVVQDWIPDCVYQFYIDSNQAERIVIKSGQTLCNECDKRIRSRDGHIEPLCEIKI